ncbi:MAG: hypothetical protein KAV82_11945 [Phycisphaerae bacterium]|nr:hypothetical protein [Phycisphaerae bacterium]
MMVTLSEPDSFELRDVHIPSRVPGSDPLGALCLVLVREFFALLCKVLAERAAAGLLDLGSQFVNLGEHALGLTRLGFVGLAVR